MHNYTDKLGLPLTEFDSYFKNDNLLDHLKEQAAKLKLSRAKAATFQAAPLKCRAS